MAPSTYSTPSINGSQDDLSNKSVPEQVHMRLCI
jgi:hypothetical protein